MCGIAGIVSLDGRPVLPDEVRSMCAVLAHRGPDDDGFAFDDGVGLGMRRLSIIDLQTGHQPIANEDGSVLVVFNGEIYNFQDLRRGLESRGHRFSTGTDTETIVHLYEELGPQCVARLRGMFAFAVWDTRQRQLLLARDRLGIKPLYYAESGGRIAFASEVKAILQLPEIERRLNWRAVSHLFAYLTTPRDESVVDGIRKLEPGHVLTVAPGQPPCSQRYWDVRFEPDYGRREADFVEELREILEETVRLHLVSDVPLGAFLSGGIDSSSVVAMMARHRSQPLKTFSIGFAEEDFNEVAYARLVARAFGTEHHELVLRPDVVGILDDLAWYLDEPLGDSSAIPTYMVSKLASEHVTVVLSGDGGDELFAGYDRYVIEGRERRLPSSVRRALGAIAPLIPPGVRGRNRLRHISLPDSERYLDTMTLVRAAEQKKLFLPEAWEMFADYDPKAEVGCHDEVMTGHWLSALQYIDLHGYLPADILTKVDRMSMAHSIEVRPPLLDHRIVEFAATIPPELKLQDGTTKYIYKRALRGILPDAVIDRPKRGFGVPLGVWLRNQLEGFARDLLLSDTCRRRSIFDPAYVERLLQRNARGRPLDYHIWTLISFELWCQIFLDTRTPHRSATRSMPESAGVQRA